MKVVKAKNITKKNFSKFGQLIDASKKNPISINDGYAKRFDDLINIDVSKDKGRAIISIFNAKKRSFPIGKLLFLALKILIIALPLSLETSIFIKSSNLFAYPSLILIGFFLDASINCPNLEKFFLVIFFAFTTFILQNFQMPLFLKFHHLDGYLF